MSHILLSSLIEATTKTTKKSSGSSAISLVVIVALFAAVYFFFLRPRSRRARQQQTTVTNLAVGDEVISAGGILGTISAIAGDEISVEVSPGYTLTFWRRAINLRTAVKGAPQSSAHVDEPAAYEDETSDGAVYENETGDEHEAGGTDYDDGQYDDGHYDDAHYDDDGEGGETHADEAEPSEAHESEYGGPADGTSGGSSEDR
jgi:preprotein translocase subunit YajC